MIHHSRDYCPICHEVTEQIKDMDEKLCKKCGKKSKRLNPLNLIC